MDGKVAPRIKIYTPPSTPNFICLVNSYRNLSGSSLKFLIREDKDKCKGSCRTHPNPIQDPIPIPCEFSCDGCTRREVSCCVDLRALPTATARLRAHQRHRTQSDGHTVP